MNVANVMAMRMLHLHGHISAVSRQRGAASSAVLTVLWKILWRQGGKPVQKCISALTHTFPGLHSAPCVQMTASLCHEQLAELASLKLWHRILLCHCIFHRTQTGRLVLQRKHKNTYTADIECFMPPERLRTCFGQ